jgi:hypothetical protein
MHERVRPKCDIVRRSPALTVSQTSSSAKLVRDAVAAADRLRRRREASVLMARSAPWAASAILVVSAASYFAGGTVVAVGVASVTVAAGLLAMGWKTRQTRRVSDEVAATIDRDAALNGELRSAHWFAVRDDADEWIVFHLDRAADRLRDRSWHEVYPAVRVGRSWAVAAALTVAAFAVPLGLPGWPGSGRTAAAAAAVVTPVTAYELALLPPELQAQIFELLAQVEAGTLRADEALARIKRLPGFSNAPPDVQELIADALDDAARRQQDVAHGSTPDDTPPPTNTADVQWARENMASRTANELARAAEQQALSEEQASGESTKSEDGALGEAGEASVGQASAKVPTKDPAAAQGATGMMMQNGADGDPGSAFGGKKGNVRYGIVEAAQLSTALKREQVEAVANVDDSDLRNQDKRRKTEQSWSSIRFSRVTRRAAFDRARLEAPHVVPEARRPLVERYFVREPAPPANGVAPSESAPRAPSPSPSERTR